VLRSLFSKLHMVAFGTFLGIVASLKLNEKIASHPISQKYAE
jgi:hypothetical protein